MSARGPRAVPVSLTPADEERLREWAGGAMGPAVAMRATIVLACADGAANAAVAAHLEVSVPTVRKWRGRFARLGPAGLTDPGEPDAAPRAPHPRPPRGEGGAVPSLLWEETANALRKAILEGELAPGERLTEEEVAARFGTSRGPVREAIRDLARDGLLVESARRSAVVCSPTESDLIEIYAVRRALEMLVVEIAPERLQPRHVSPLEGHLDELEACWRRGGDFLEAARHDLAFHRELLALTGNRRAIDANERLLAQTILLLRTAAERQPRLRSEMDRRVHRDILDALGAGDREGLRRAIDDHHREALDRLFEIVR